MFNHYIIDHPSYMDNTIEGSNNSNELLLFIIGIYLIMNKT